MTRPLLRLSTVVLTAIVALAAARGTRAADPAPPGAADPAAAAPIGMSLAEVFFIQRHPSTKEVEWFGSAIIWALLALSATSLAMMGALARDNRRESIVPEGLADRLREILREKRAAYAADVAAQSGSFLGDVVRAGLAEAGAGHAAMLRAAESAAEELTLRRLRRVEPLGVIGNVAPMVGLFGTVYGIILAFRAIVSAGGAPDPVSLAAGIGTALVTTFWGLVVAIPALSAYAVIRGRIDGMTLEAAREAENLLGLMRGAAPKNTAERTGERTTARAAESSVGVPV